MILSNHVQLLSSSVGSILMVVGCRLSYLVIIQQYEYSNSALMMTQIALSCYAVHIKVNLMHIQTANMV